MRKRAAFLTIGQSPRPDILEEMAPAWGEELDIVQHGVLDGLSESEIQALAPVNDEPRLVSRLRDGTETVVRAASVHERMQELVRRLDDDRDENGEEVDLLVLLCTGHFDDLVSRHLLVKAQPVVDHGVAALSTSCSRVGVLVPVAEQAMRLDGLASYASPYSPHSPHSEDRFERAAEELGEADLIALHCMGYTMAHKRRMAELTGKPVLLAREMVATAVSWLVR